MKKEFVVNRQGKDFVLYAGLLDQAHAEGLKRVTTQLVQAPTEDNGHTTIVWAEVETAKGLFTGIGDATPQNVGRMIVPHAIRMAETRAKARALRDAINVGTTAVEELREDDDETPVRGYPAAPGAGTETVESVYRSIEAGQQLMKLDFRTVHPVPIGLPLQDAQRQLSALRAEYDRLRRAEKVRLDAASGRS